jgi:RNA polymerase sigma-70 factor (ECF subfamily)
MDGRDGSAEKGSRALVYCLVPRDLAPGLHDSLRRHFGDDPAVEVVVERRADERRSDPDRRAVDASPAAERRLIRSRAGRRVGDRRGTLVAVDPPALPRRARARAGCLTFVERLEPSGTAREDLDTGRLVTRFQAGERDVFAILYMRYFDRVYAYASVALNDAHEAEDATQQIFVRAFEALPRYEHRKAPFRAWLFTIVRNYTLNQLRRAARVEAMDPSVLSRLEDTRAAEDADLDVLGWISDRELLFIERLPAVQRQTLVLRFMLDLSTAQIASILHRSESDVRVLQTRALRFLRARLSAVGAQPARRRDRAAPRCARQAPVLRMRRFALISR